MGQVGAVVVIRSIRGRVSQSRTIWVRWVRERILGSCWVSERAWMVAQRMKNMRRQQLLV